MSNINQHGMFKIITDIFVGLIELKPWRRNAPALSMAASSYHGHKDVVFNSAHIRCNRTVLYRYFEVSGVKCFICKLQNNQDDCDIYENFQ